MCLGFLSEFWASQDENIYLRWIVYVFQQGKYKDMDSVWYFSCSLHCFGMIMTYHRYVPEMFSRSFKEEG